MAGTLDVTLRAHGGAPALSGVLRVPEPDARGRDGTGVAVLCHPHPAFGGTKDVWLLPALAHALAQDGWWVLRFDVRGVGASEGRFGDGTAEVDDVVAALRDVEARWRRADPARPAGVRPRRAVVGWSFGAAIALHAAVRDGVDDWVGICPPTRALPDVPMLDPVPPGLGGADVRRTAVVAEHDAFYPPATVHVLQPHRVIDVAGADHFLFDRDREVAALVVAALRAAARGTDDVAP